MGEPIQNICAMADFEEDVLALCGCAGETRQVIVEGDGHYLIVARCARLQPHYLSMRIGSGALS